MKNDNNRRPSAASIKKKYGFKNAKSLGQNFLNDMGVIEAIIEGSQIGPEDLVIEIGPGMGVLTAAAAEFAGKVVAVEIDTRLMPVLKETLAGYFNITVLNQDIMKTDLPALIAEHFDADGEGKVRIVGNIPYYITTPILMMLLESRVEAETITLMMQKEVADRIEAQPGSRTYGALSVAVSYYCSVERIADVPKECFSPPPKVDSAVLCMTRRKEPPVPVTDEKLFFDIVKAGFGKRRKTLTNALTGLHELTKDDAKEILEKAGVAPSRRAETLDLQEFALIAEELAQVLKDRQAAE